MFWTYCKIVHFPLPYQGHEVIFVLAFYRKKLRILRVKTDRGRPSIRVWPQVDFHSHCSLHTVSIHVLILPISVLTSLGLQQILFQVKRSLFWFSVFAYFSRFQGGCLFFDLYSQERSLIFSLYHFFLL